ncbi:piwi-like protein Siwi [Brevipalpus obovatus]|uniref:piwi-like protein Siwi n=1 Tax=Brevipalpus obovatus TaxID=246614 RepID=UPI003D9DDBCF
MATGGGQRGDSSRPLDLLTNYFKVKVPDNVINHYHVVFSPDIESSRIRRHLIEQNKDSFKQAYIFDGMSDLKTLEQLPATLRLTGIRSNDNEEIDIEITRVGTVACDSKEMERLLNTLIRRFHRLLGMIQIDRHYYEKKPVGRSSRGDVEIRRGLQTAIAFHSGGLLMQMDTIFKFSRTKSVRNQIFEIMNANRDGRSDWKALARGELQNQIVMTIYNNKTYKVEDLDFNLNPMSTFQLDGTGEVTYVDYYARRYVDASGNPIRIQDPRQPLLKCRPSRRNRGDDNERPLYLVPELCVLTGLTEEMRKDFNFMKEIAQYSRMDPTPRARHLVESMKSLKSSRGVQQELGTWGVELSSELLQVKGKQIAPPQLSIPGCPPKFVERGDFTNDIRSKRLSKPVGLDRWVIIHTQRGERDVDSFRQTLKKVAAPLGVQLGEPKKLITQGENAGGYIDCLRKIPEGAQIVVCIVPNDNKHRYDAIKVYCLVKSRLQSQVIKQRNLMPGPRLMSVVTKILFQMQAKIGAETWALTSMPKKYMVIGYDTFHDQPSLKKRSAGAFIASMNDNFTSYYSLVHFHENREEMSSNFTSNLKKSLQKYRELNKTYPQSIIIYRDGVGEGQYDHVKDHELSQVKDAIQSCGPQQQIKLTFMIVSKRINTRLFLRQGSDLRNPYPGTVVDQVITRPKHPNFYLVSQHVGQGTVTPTAYDIIHDDIKMPLTKQQLLAYHLTHLYYNWMGTVKVPAPCQYAHKLAYLVGKSLHEIPHESHSDKLFYL